MANKPKRPGDANQLAKFIADMATGDTDPQVTKDETDQSAKAKGGEGQSTVPEPRVEIIADMALAMQEAMHVLSAEKGEVVNLRIGIHTGPAIAGVIGTSKVFSDVWGDTVNTASRMEGHGEPGRIHVTATPRDALREAFAFASCGKVEVKGIGAIETYWLEHRA